MSLTPWFVTNLINATGCVSHIYGRYYISFSTFDSLCQSLRHWCVVRLIRLMKSLGDAHVKSIVTCQRNWQLHSFKLTVCLNLENICRESSTAFVHFERWLSSVPRRDLRFLSTLLRFFRDFWAILWYFNIIPSENRIKIQEISKNPERILENLNRNRCRRQAKRLRKSLLT